MVLSSPKTLVLTMVLIQHYCPYRTYVSIDHLSSLVLSLGREALLIKADIKEAYRMVPIDPQDQQLLGVQWRGVVFIDRVLPFGLRSAPKFLLQSLMLYSGYCQPRE